MSLLRYVKATLSKVDAVTALVLPSTCFFPMLAQELKAGPFVVPSDYCYVQSTDGGSTGDEKLRPYEGCPLGRSARTVLYVLLQACPTFSEKIINSVRCYCCNGQRFHGSRAATVARYARYFRRVDSARQPYRNGCSECALGERGDDGNGAWVHADGPLE